MTREKPTSLSSDIIFEITLMLIKKVNHSPFLNPFTLFQIISLLYQNKTFIANSNVTGSVEVSLAGGPHLPWLLNTFDTIDRMTIH